MSKDNDVVGQDDSPFVEEADIKKAKKKVDKVDKVTTSSIEADSAGEQKVDIDEAEAESDTVGGRRKYIAEDVDSSDYEYVNTSGAVKLSLESQGRFSLPTEMFFKDWVYEHIHDLSLTRQEDRIESIVGALNDLKVGNEDTDMFTATPEELFEILVGIKVKYSGKNHKHRWICNCQHEVEESDRKPSEQNIDLTTLHYRSVGETDQVLRDWYKSQLLKMEEVNGEKAIKEWLGRQKGSPETIDEYLEVVKVQEPFFIKDKDHTGIEHTYEFRWLRIKDLVRAKTLVNREHETALKALKSRKWDRNSELSTFKFEQAEAMRKLQEKKEKDLMLYALSMSLMKYNGTLLNENERFNFIRKMSKAAHDQLIKYRELSYFGIVDEREYICNLCGHTERRLLQRSSTLLEFLPLADDTDSGLQEFESTFVSFGI